MKPGFPTMAHSADCFCSSCEDKRLGGDIKQNKMLEERSAKVMKLLGFPLVKEAKHG